MALFKRNEPIEKTATMTHRRSILVVEDEEPVRMGICKALSKAGFEVVDVASGEAAVYRLLHEHFDAVISDIRMPEMSGLDLVHALNKLSEGTLVVLLTAVPDPDGSLQRIVKEAGVFAYLNKPCSLHQIVGALEAGFAAQEATLAGAQSSAQSQIDALTQLQSTVQPPTETQPQTETEPRDDVHEDSPPEVQPDVEAKPAQDPAPSEDTPAENKPRGKYSILVVADNNPARNSLCQDLLKAGHHVEAVSVKRNALAAAASTSFHVMIVDIKASGLEAFEMMRQMTTMYPDTVIIVLTTPDPRIDLLKSKSMDHGAAGFFTHPCDLDELMDVIADLCPPVSDFIDRM